MPATDVAGMLLLYRRSSRRGQGGEDGACRSFHWTMLWLARLCRASGPGLEESV